MTAASGEDAINGGRAQRLAASRDMFLFLDQYFMPKHGACGKLPECPLLQSNRIDETAPDSLAYLTTVALNDSPRSVQVAKIASYCTATMSADGTFLRNFLFFYSNDNVVFDDPRATLSFRYFWYRWYTRAHNPRSLVLSELLNRVDTFALELVFDGMRRQLGAAGLSKALDVVLVPGTQVPMDSLVALCRSLDPSPADVQASPFSMTSVLRDLVTRVVRRHTRQERSRAIISWMFLSFRPEELDGVVAPTTLQRVRFAHGVSIQRCTRFPDRKMRHRIPAIPASPVYPIYAPGRVGCSGWGVPTGFDTAGRSPFEASRYFRLEAAEVLDDWTVLWSENGALLQGDTGESDGQIKSQGLVDIRTTKRRWREYGRQNDVTAIDVTKRGLVRRAGRYFLGSNIRFSGNFGHFIYQILPNISTYLNLINDKRKIVIDGKEHSFHREFLNYISVNPDEVLFTNDITILEGDISFFEESYGPQVNALRLVELRKRIPRPDTSRSPYGKRIYLSRRRVATRKTGNAEEFEAFVQSRGFDVVIPDDHKAPEQVAILDNADIVISPHGSALTNLVFCQRPKTIIEGHSKTSPPSTTFMHMLSHRAYWSKMVQKLDDSGTMQDHWKIDEVRALLDKLL